MGLVSNEGLPEESALAGDSVPALREALAGLPTEQQRALVLAAVYGRTAAEISESETIPLGTAKTRIRAGMSKLRSGNDRPGHLRMGAAMSADHLSGRGACVDVEGSLAELALGILPGDERAVVLAHLESCERCQAEAERVDTDR